MTQDLCADGRQQGEAARVCLAGRRVLAQLHVRAGAAVGEVEVRQQRMPVRAQQDVLRLQVPASRTRQEISPLGLREQSR